MKPYYDKDGITLYCGDCREVLPTLPQCDLMLTDPPYGITLANHEVGTNRANGDWTRSNKQWDVSGDTNQTLGNEVLASWDGATIAFASPKLPWDGKWRQHLVWEKGEHVGGGGDPDVCWKLTWEMIQVRGNGPLVGRRDSAVLKFPAVKDDYGFHPTPKPVALLSYLIHKSAATYILDPFAGSGTTLVAAKLLGRRAIGIEISEEYCRIAVNRLRQGVLELVG